MAEKLYFTAPGLDKMREQAEELEQKLRNLEAQISEAAEVGGNQWHDNFSYEQLTQQIRAMDQRLRDVRRLLNQAVLAERADGSVVTIGTKVKIDFGGEKEEWFVGGFGESDPDNNIIAYNTPLAQLLLGKKVEEKTSGHLGNKKVEITILGIEAVSI